MTGVIVIDDGTPTGVRIHIDKGTSILSMEPDSTMTISFGVISSMSKDAKKVQEKDWDEEERERERVKRMREGWRDIRKGHERRQ
jgi:hypothetical protein